MTADEKALVERLDRNAKFVRERNGNPPILTVLSEEAAALIRAQEAKIARMAEALKKVLDATEAEATATLSHENALKNFSDARPEKERLYRAMLVTSTAFKAEKDALRDAGVSE